MKVSKEVYSPAEDSYLLEECILKENLVGKKCLDLGTGSGVQGIAMLKSSAKELTCVDINPVALKVSKNNILGCLENSKKERTQYVGHSKQCLKFKKSNLFSSLKKEKFDFIAFNPPYVPSDEVKWVDLDGGENGRETIDKFLNSFANHLNKNGVLLLLISSLNKPSEIKKKLKELGFTVKVIGKKKLFFEELLVFRVKV